MSSIEPCLDLSSLITRLRRRQSWWSESWQQLKPDVVPRVVGGHVVRTRHIHRILINHEVTVKIKGVQTSSEYQRKDLIHDDSHPCRRPLGQAVPAVPDDGREVNSVPGIGNLQPWTLNNKSHLFSKMISVLFTWVVLKSRNALVFVCRSSLLAFRTTPISTSLSFLMPIMSALMSSLWTDPLVANGWSDILEERMRIEKHSLRITSTPTQKSVLLATISSLSYPKTCHKIYRCGLLYLHLSWIQSQCQSCQLACEWSTFQMIHFCQCSLSCHRFSRCRSNRLFQEYSCHSSTYFPDCYSVYFYY